MYSQVQTSPPPDYDDTGNKSGEGAPMNGGFFILLGLGAVYGAGKVFNNLKEELEE